MCEHHWVVASADPPDKLRRRLFTFSCDKCSEQMSRLTARTDKQIQAELDAQ